MKERIGVYICHCGGNISDYVDVEEIGKMLQGEDGVVISKDVMFACADSNQKAMVNDIKEHHLDAIVVASCSPKLHLHTFKGVAARADLNPSNYVQVNIREQCSWPHSDQKHEASVKAVGLIRAGIKRVSHSESLENIEIQVKRAVLVVGAGLAGMRSSVELARMGNEVYLVENDYFVGGRTAQHGSLFMGGNDGKELVASMYAEMRKLPNITIFTGSTIEKVSGSIGNFSVDIKINPRYINGKSERADVEKAMDECSVMVPDLFRHGISERKAIYKSYPSACPDVPVVDVDALKNETAFLEKYAKVIDLNQQPELLNLSTGAVIVTTGFDSYIPKQGEYHYENHENVITLPVFLQLMEQNGGVLQYDGKRVNKVAFIYCVGNRQAKGDNKYCSRTCCSSTMQASLVLNEKFENITSYHVYRDIRTYGKQEILFEKASKQGDVFIRFNEKDPPVVDSDSKGLLIKVKDHLTSKMELEIPADLVVLVTGMVPRADSLDISGKFKIPVGSDKFFNEIHPKLKPVETVIKGVYIGGACQGPKNITESLQSSLSAAAKVNALLKGGSVSLDPIVASVNANACLWCGKCAEVCEYSAIREIESSGKHIAAVNRATCTGCGICAPVCPTNAIEVAQYTDLEIEAMIDGFTEKAELAVHSEKQEEVTDKNAVTMKEYPQLWKSILGVMNGGRKTIPEVAEALNMKTDSVTWQMMTMNKYSIIVADGLDSMEVYYYYKIKNSQS
ncbi:MAG: CoB--CoM heterodisulfide reductase iron-sulfur subunit A family protein [Bacteroidota bacterium]